MHKYITTARWQRVNFLYTMFSLFRCSACGCVNEYTNFCPTCGAEMDIGGTCNEK